MAMIGMAKDQITIRSGNGSIIIDGSLLPDLKDNWLLLELHSEKGPCPDGMCQLRMEVKGSLSGSVDNPMLEKIQLGNISLAVDKLILRAIDRGRETVKVIKKGKGRIRVKGFTYTT